MKKITKLIAWFFGKEKADFCSPFSFCVLLTFSNCIQFGQETIVVLSTYLHYST